MKFNRLKHAILRLSIEEKVMGLGSLCAVIGAFLPWHQITMSFDGEVIQNTGLSGDLGVIGFVILLMGLMGLLMLVAENLHLPLPKLGYKREQILFFLLGQSTFLTLLSIAIYTKRSIEFTDAGLRFGIYVVLIGALFGAFSALSLIQKIQRKDALEFFHSQEDEDGSIGEPENEEEELPSTEEPMAFKEDAELEAKLEHPTESEELPQHPIAKERYEADADLPKSQGHQANYFTREAGISEKKGEKDRNPSMDFYEDQ